VTGLPILGVPQHDLLSVLQALLLLVRDCQDLVLLTKEHLMLLVASFEANRVFDVQFFFLIVYLILAEFWDFIFIQE
jgi:hypothetical protein